MKCVINQSSVLDAKFSENRCSRDQSYINKSEK